MTRIGRLFDRLRRDGRKGLIAYLTAGDPEPARTPALVEALVRGGVKFTGLWEDELGLEEVFLRVTRGETQ